jgi:hypothetical protein
MVSADAMPPDAISGLLRAWGHGDPGPRPQLLPLVKELRRRASGTRASSRTTLQPGARHEASGSRPGPHQLAESRALLRRRRAGGAAHTGNHAREHQSAKRPVRRFASPRRSHRRVGAARSARSHSSKKRCRVVDARPRQGQIVEFRYFATDVRAGGGGSPFALNRHARWRTAAPGLPA